MNDNELLSLAKILSLVAHDAVKKQTNLASSLHLFKDTYMWIVKMFKLSIIFWVISSNFSTQI